MEVVTVEGAKAEGLGEVEGAVERVEVEMGAARAAAPRAVMMVVMREERVAAMVVAPEAVAGRVREGKELAVVDTKVEAATVEGGLEMAVAAALAREGVLEAAMAVAAMVVATMAPSSGSIHCTRMLRADHSEAQGPHNTSNQGMIRKCRACTAVDNRLPGTTAVNSAVVLATAMAEVVKEVGRVEARAEMVKEVLRAVDKDEATVKEATVAVTMVVETAVATVVVATVEVVRLEVEMVVATVAVRAVDKEEATA